MLTFTEIHVNKICRYSLIDAKQREQLELNFGIIPTNQKNLNQILTNFN